MKIFKKYLSIVLSLIFTFILFNPGISIKANQEDEIIWITEDELKDPFIIPTDGFKVTASSYQAPDKPENVIDGDETTKWHSSWGIQQKGHELNFDLGKIHSIKSIEYVPRLEGGNGTFNKCVVKTSNDGVNYEIAQEFTLSVNSAVKTMTLDESINTKYIKLVVDGSNNNASAVEIRFMEKAEGKDVDRVQLKRYIYNAISIDKTKYTEESLKEFIKLVDKPVEVYNDKNSTQEDIDNECEVLKLAMNTLVRKEESIMKFQLLGDVHIGYTSRGIAPIQGLTDEEIKFRNVLDLIGLNEENSDAVVFPGDFTDTGSELQYSKFFKMLNEENPAKNSIVTLGNHDVRDDNYEVTLERYKKYHLNEIDEKNGVDGTNRNVPYFTTEIAGYTFVVVNSEAKLASEAYISNEQLEWLDKTLAAENEKDSEKPIFLITHQGLKNSIPYSNIHNIGPSDFDIKHIVAKYPQTIYINGHTHNKFGTTQNLNGEVLSMKYDKKYVNMLDTPSTYFNGEGYFVEVFKDRVELLAYDFQNGKWKPEYDQVVRLPIDYIPMVDLDAPNWGGIELTGVANNRGVLNLKWTMPKDNIGITQYKIMQDGNTIANLSSDKLSFNVGKLKAGITYTFKIEARDEEGNWSKTGPEFKFTPEISSNDLGYYNSLPEEIKNKLMVYLNFDENVTDISNNVTTETLDGALMYKDSPFGSSGNFNNTNSLSLGVLDYGMDDFTTSFWVNAKGSGGTDGAVIVSNKDFYTRTNPGWVIASVNSTKLWHNTGLIINGSKVHIDDRGVSNIELFNGEWNYFTISTDRTNNVANVYKNGVKVYSYDISRLAGQSMTVNNKTVIGADGKGTHYGGRLDFNIDEFMIVKKALSDKEIKEMYELYDLTGKMPLQYLVKEAKEIDSNLYTEESINELNNYLNIAEVILASEGASLEDTKEAYRNLNAALNNLILEEVEDNIKPEKPINFKLNDYTNNTVDISWEKPINNQNIKEYCLYLDGKLLDTVSANSELEYELSNLDSNTIYGIKITSKSKNGLESKPSSLNIRTRK